jgi:hypothetical protein
LKKGVAPDLDKCVTPYTNNKSESVKLECTPEPTNSRNDLSTSSTQNMTKPIKRPSLKMAISHSDLHANMDQLGVTPTQKRSLIQISENGKSVENVQVGNQNHQSKHDVAVRRERADIYAKKFKMSDVTGANRSKLSNNRSYQSSTSKSPRGNKKAKWKNLTNMYMQNPIDFTSSKLKMHKKRTLKTKRRSKALQTENIIQDISNLKKPRGKFPFT